jgi:hypothetical protein
MQASEKGKAGRQERAKTDMQGGKCMQIKGCQGKREKSRYKKKASISEQGRARQGKRRETEEMKTRLYKGGR